MTKKTNSLVLRYGISTLWKKKTSSVDVFSNIWQLDKLINVWLKKKNLNLVVIKHGLNLLRIFVYKRFFLDERLKNIIIKYYKKTLSESLVIQKFGVQKNQLDYILSECIIKKKGKSNIVSKNKIYYFLSGLHYKKYLSLLILKVIQSFLVSKINPGSFLVKTLVLFLTGMNFLNEPKLSVFLKKNISLRKINGFLKLNLIVKSLENLLFKLKSKKIIIKIKNIYLTKGFFRLPFFGKQIIKPEFRFKFFTMFLAMAYTNSSLISDFVSDLIKKGKQHRKNLQIFINFFERIFSPRLLTLSGFQLRVSGKLGGKLRKSKYHYKIGKVQLQTFKHLLSYSFTTSYTKFGVFSIKVWLIQQNEFNLL